MYKHLLRKDLKDITTFKVIYDFCDIRKGALLLDVGCGLGYLLNWISTEKKTIGVGVDFSLPAIKLGRKLFSSPALNRALAQNLPFRDCVFDCVILFNVIEHVGSQYHHRVLTEIKRVLKRGGVFIIGTVDKNSIYTKLFIHDKTHIHEFDKMELIRLVSEFFEIDCRAYTSAVARFPKFTKFINKLFTKFLASDIIIKCIKK